MGVDSGDLRSPPSLHLQNSSQLEFYRSQSNPPPRIVSAAIIVYSILIAMAFFWGYLAGRPHVLWNPTKSTWVSCLIGLLAGTGFGATFVLLTRAAASKIAWAKELTIWLGSILGPISWRDAFVVAIFSSFGEEMFFRGAMQPNLGLTWTTIIFGLLHVAPRLRFASWTLLAGVLGLLFGIGAIWTGNLAGPIAAHFVINFFNLKLTSQMAASATSEKLPQVLGESSLTEHAIESNDQIDSHNYPNRHLNKHNQS
ncbi:MAG: type II CAAX endopeptidase family protein [Pseudomonadota bacterium]